MRNAEIDKEGLSLESKNSHISFASHIVGEGWPLDRLLDIYI